MLTDIAGAIVAHQRRIEAARYGIRRKSAVRWHTVRQTRAERASGR